MQVTVQHVDGLRFLGTADGHTVVVDAAVADGGGGTAFSAPQLFAAAVGTCLLEFVANSCRLHGLPVTRLHVEIHTEEQAQPRRLGVIEAKLCIEPEPSEDMKRRLIGVARHATLANTLARPPELAIQFIDQTE